MRQNRSEKAETEKAGTESTFGGTTDGFQATLCLRIALPDKTPAQAPIAVYLNDGGRDNDDTAQSLSPAFLFLRHSPGSNVCALVAGAGYADVTRVVTDGPALPSTPHVLRTLSTVVVPRPWPWWRRHRLRTTTASTPSAIAALTLAPVQIQLFAGNTAGTGADPCDAFVFPQRTRHGRHGCRFQTSRLGTFVWEEDEDDDGAAVLSLYRITQVYGSIGPPTDNGSTSTLVLGRPRDGLRLLVAQLHRGRGRLTVDSRGGRDGAEIASSDDAQQQHELVVVAAVVTALSLLQEG